MRLVQRQCPRQCRPADQYEQPWPLLRTETAEDAGTEDIDEVLCEVDGGN